MDSASVLPSVKLDAIDCLRHYAEEQFQFKAEAQSDISRATLAFIDAVSARLPPVKATFLQTGTFVVTGNQTNPNAFIVLPLLTRVVAAIVRGLALGKGSNLDLVLARDYMLRSLTTNKLIVNFANEIVKLDAIMDVGQSITCIDALVELAIYLPAEPTSTE